VDADVLSAAGAARARGQRGFTLIEVMAAMAITVVVMMANLSMFDTAQKRLAGGRALTKATNIATERINDFKTMTISQIFAAAPTVVVAGPVRRYRGSDSGQFLGAGETGDLVYTRTWDVSDVDYDHDGVPDMAGDVVKVSVTVTWDLQGKSHAVTMASFTTGKPT
jgi:prepilin-type N-terminal cleavage/methylation domain-containing protein